MAGFGDQNALKMCFVLACFQIIFLSISESNFRRLGLPNRGFRMECIAEIDLSWKSCLVNLGMEFDRFSGVFEAVSSDFDSSKTGMQTQHFLVI